MFPDQYKMFTEDVNVLKAEPAKGQGYGKILKLLDVVLLEELLKISPGTNEFSHQNA